jgi:dinuclear metal center YbgI/SA1388 family protein
MRITVNDIIGVMKKIAPPNLAESWDNVGLQIGDPTWPVQRIWVALDPIPEVIQAAINQNIDLIITHHPLFFQPIKSIDLSKPESKIIADAISHKIAIYSAHTNLDKVTGGINDLLANKLNLLDIRPMIPEKSSDKAKLVVFVPNSHVQQVMDALFEKNAGVIGQYEKCAFKSDGIGTFQPTELSKPFLGKKGQFEETKECRIETIISLKNAPAIINHLEKNHPYETVAYDIYPLNQVSDSSDGLGRVGHLKTPMRLQELADHIIKCLNLSYVRVIGDPELIVNQLAVCSGSGGSLIDKVVSLGVQAYVTGDLKYHDARSIEMHQLGAIDVAHFESEHIFIDDLVPKLLTAMEKRQWTVEILPCPVERNPFYLKT